MTTRAKEEMVIRAIAASGATTPTTGDGQVGEADIQAAAKPIMAELEANLRAKTDLYVQESMKQSKDRPSGQGFTTPVTAVYPPYPWWEMLFAGPFQPGPLPGGPYLPNRIIRAGDPAFMIGVLWRNPAPINWGPPAPSAAVVMSAYNFSIRLETVNLSTVTDGPDAGPIDLAPIGGGYLNLFAFPLTFPAPPQSKPDLYEINMTADVSGPVSGLPFAGYSTWWLDPDTTPPFLFLPSVPGGFRHDVPARVLVYTP